MARLMETYRNEIVPELKKDLGLENPMRVPRLKKIVVNMGIGIAEKNAMDKFVGELAVITGQKPIVTKARKSISNFKLREGMPIGAKVTLRGKRMYEFMDRLVNAALPRIRDFRGLSADAFDGRGSYSIGIREQSIFPEIDPNQVGENQGMDITVVTSAENKEVCYALLKALGMPFVKMER